MVRCFVGYLLTDDEKEKIVDLQKEMEKWPMKCKFVEKENLHLNFSFLGEVDENEIKKISERIDEIGKNFKRFEVEVNGLIAIPSQNYIRVLALAVIYNESLKRVFEEITKNIGGDSKSAHITLCRVKSIAKKEEIKHKIEEEKKNHGKIIIKAIQLIKSEIKRSGPVYSVIHQTGLS